jgi:hypothetical protein
MRTRYASSVQRSSALGGDEAIHGILHMLDAEQPIADGPDPHDRSGMIPTILMDLEVSPQSVGVSKREISCTV